MPPSFGAASHAILLGLDGIAVDSLHEWMDGGYLPNLKALRVQGAFTDDDDIMGRLVGNNRRVTRPLTVGGPAPIEGYANVVPTV